MDGKDIENEIYKNKKAYCGRKKFFGSKIFML
jgi:hypothetical protein